MPEDSAHASNGSMQDPSDDAARVEHPIIESLRRAVQAAPTDVHLRLLLAEQLLSQRRFDEAIREAAGALVLEPGSQAALELMNRAAVRPQDSPGTGAAARPSTLPSDAGPAPTADDVSSAPGSPPAGDTDEGADDQRAPASFDWEQAESDLGVPVPPMFVDDAHHADPFANDLERSSITFADVGGMEHVKARLEAAFLMPLRNPELRRMYAKSLRGGLLLYGPPGCGKTFIARAVAGEMGAGFINISINDVLDAWIGSSERNMHATFERARRSAPCVVFLDELDALGHKRANLSSGMRSTVNQLLQELDGIGADNEGVFLLAASNQPWDIDPALRRPGRLDRTLLVLPPDELGRAAILKTHLADRPIAGIDLRKLAQQTDGFSGADLAHLCESAAELALISSVKTGTPRMIEMADLQAALQTIQPSTGPWFDSARNVATFANSDGQYDEILAYLKKRRRR